MFKKEIYTKLKFGSRYTALAVLRALEEANVPFTKNSQNKLFDVYESIFNRVMNKEFRDPESEDGYKELQFKDLAPVGTLQIKDGVILNTNYLDRLSYLISENLQFVRNNILPTIKNTVLSINKEMKLIDGRTVTINKKIKRAEVDEFIFDSFDYYSEDIKSFDLKKEVLLTLGSEFDIIDIVNERQSSPFAQKLVDYLKGSYESKFLQGMVKELSYFTSGNIFNSSPFYSDDSFDKLKATYCLLLLFKLRGYKDVRSSINDEELAIYIPVILNNLFKKFLTIQQLERDSGNPIVIYGNTENVIYVNSNIYSIMEENDLNMDIIIGATLLNELNTRYRVLDIKSNLDKIKSVYNTTINKLKIDADTEGKKQLRLFTNNYLLENIEKMPCLTDDEDRKRKFVEHVNKVLTTINISKLENLEKFVAEMVIALFPERSVIGLIYKKIEEYYNNLEITPNDSIPYIVYEIALENLILQLDIVEG